MNSIPQASVVDMPTSRSAVNSGSRPLIEVGVLGDAYSVEGIVRILKSQDEKWCRVEALEADEGLQEFDAERFDVVVIAEDESAGTSRREEWIDRLSRLGVGQIVLSSRMADHHGEGTVGLPPDTPLERLRGVMTALAQWRSALRAHARQLAGMHRLHQSLHKHFDEIDRELQLASRLQRDFLPRGATKIGPFRFSTLFRPCTWVSGDIFDIFQLDETHVGFYLADAIGHGVAAGLLTMYIKHAIKPKRVSLMGAEMVRPSEVLAMLNDQLSAQDLPDSQFITGWYGVIDTQTLRLDFANAGHPPPIVIEHGEMVRELHGEGSILGLCPGQSYSDESIQLRPGQRVLLYSDGLEPALIRERRPVPALSILQPDVRSLVAAPADALIGTLVSQLDAQPGSLMHADDVSLLILDVENGCDANHTGN